MQHHIIPNEADGHHQLTKPRHAKTVTAARALLETFARRGVRYAFGIPGGLISPVFDALIDVPEIQLVSTRHETMAAFCAMGAAIATGAPALVLTTSGPGITNAITGLSAALLEEIPMILLSGDVSAASANRAGFQDASTNGIDAVAMLRTVSRWSTRVDSAAGAIGAAEQAMRVACGERPGPVFLSLPLDIGNTTLGKDGTTSRMSMGELPRTSIPDKAACREALTLLRSARRPLLVLGNGARSAAPEIIRLMERLPIPVVTTPHAKGVFPESHPLHLGGIGFGGHPSATAYIASRPDVVCVVGSRLGDFATNGWSVPLEGLKATIQIDREPRLIGRNYPVTLGIVSDAASAIRTIHDLVPLDQNDPEQPKSGLHRRPGIRRLIAKVGDPHGAGLEPAHVLGALQNALPDAFWAVDIGEHCAHALHHLRIDEPDQFRTMIGFGSMGSGIGVAMGARLANRERPVVAICGDGGFAMHAGDILTCVEQRIGCLFVVMNDGKWNIVDHGFGAVFGRIPGGLPSRIADLAAVARGFGAVGECITSLDQLDVSRFRSVLDSGCPVVLDVRIDPTATLSVSTRSSALRQAAFGGAQ